MLIVSRSKDFDGQPPILEVVIEAEDCAGKALITASTTFKFGSSNNNCSVPSSLIKPCPVVGMVPLVQPHAFQFKSTFKTVLSIFPHPPVSTLCPANIKNSPGCKIV